MIMIVILTVTVVITVIVAVIEVTDLDIIFQKKTGKWKMVLISMLAACQG